MRLRTIGLIGALVLGVLAGSLPTEAQQPKKVYRIGYLRDGSGIGRYEELFRHGLRELGYIEGQNIIIEWRFPGGRMYAPISKMADHFEPRRRSSYPTSPC